MDSKDKNSITINGVTDATNDWDSDIAVTETETMPNNVTAVSMKN